MGGGLRGWGESANSETDEKFFGVLSLELGNSRWMSGEPLMLSAQVLQTIFQMLIIHFFEKEEDI